MPSASWGLRGKEKVGLRHAPSRMPKLAFQQEEKSKERAKEEIRGDRRATGLRTEGEMGGRSDQSQQALSDGPSVDCAQLLLAG